MVSGDYCDDEDSYLPTSWLVPVRASAPRPPSPPPVASGHVAQDDEIPEQIYVPVFPLGVGRQAQLMLELWQHGDGVIAVGYSELSRLVEQLGGAQPWAMTTTRRLRPLLARGVNALFLDPPPGTVEQRWTEQQLDSLREVNNGMAASRPR